MRKLSFALANITCLIQLLCACGGTVAPCTDISSRVDTAADEDRTAKVVSAAEAAATGLLIHIDNALEAPLSGSQTMTPGHLDVRLCGLEERTVVVDGEVDTAEYLGHCQDRVDAVGPGERAIFYLNAEEALWLTAASHGGTRLRLFYRSTGQEEATWHAGSDTDLHPDVREGKQIIEATVFRADHLGDLDALQTSFYPQDFE